MMSVDQGEAAKTTKKLNPLTAETAVIARGIIARSGTPTNAAATNELRNESLGKNVEVEI